MPAPKVDVEQKLREALAEILNVRARLVEVIQERRATRRPGVGTLVAGCAKLDLFAAEMQGTLDAILARDLGGGDPAVLREIEEIHRQFVDGALKDLGAAIEELSEGPEPELVN